MNPLSFFYQIYEKILWRQIKQGPTPHHIGLILDGNRRFARFHKLASSNDGHNAGSDNVESFLDWCRGLDVKIVTLYGFSVENYNRSDQEVDHLMSLILKKLKDYQIDPVIVEERVKVKVLGRLENLSDEMNQEIAKIQELTKDHEKFQLNIALSYGGRAEIVDAVKKVAREVRDGQLDVDTLDEDLFSNYLYTQGIPDPDFIIRTSGEERLSGFLSWQSAYSELYFTEVFWPAFRKIDFWRAIRVYQQRERRFGR
jgi:tritrans,polycis-undecaprenyl-diphosphate synthase [geranylgeranyl-diphosphate specific]